MGVQVSLHTYNDLSIMTPDKPAQETDDQTADRAQKHS